MQILKKERVRREKTACSHPTGMLFRKTSNIQTEKITETRSPEKRT